MAYRGGTTEDERRAMQSLPGTCQLAREIVMANVISQQNTQNKEYVRRLLRRKQPEFAAALELAMDLVERELMSPMMQRQRFRGLVTSSVPPPAAADIAHAIAGQLGFMRPAGVHDDRTCGYWCCGFARDFATADVRTSEPLLQAGEADGGVRVAVGGLIEGRPGRSRPA